MSTFDVPEPVTRLLDAATGHDTEAFLASFTEDGVVDDWGREFIGADSIRGWSDREFIGVEVTLDVTGSPRAATRRQSAPRWAARASTAPATSRSPFGTASLRG